MTNTAAIVLDTPDQIQMWVLLSRRFQVKQHLAGMKVPGLLSSLKREIGPHCTTMKKAQFAVEEAIVAAGGGPDESLVNFHVAMQTMPGIYRDLGIFDTIADANAFVSVNYPNATNADAFHMEITQSPVRVANDTIYVQ